MSGLARLLIILGYQVSASDAHSSPYLDDLATHGAETWIGSHPEKIRKKSIIFYSTAIPKNNPERIHAQKNNIPEYSRQPLLRFLTEKYYTIAVSGTHGKTTTSAWLALLLQKAGFDPTVLLGGKSLDFGSSFISGKGTIDDQPILLIEADESDNSFLQIFPKIAVITNIEMDHPDQHESLKSIQESFFKFISQTIDNQGIVISSFETTDMIYDLVFRKNLRFASINKNLAKKIILDPKNNTIFYKEIFYQIGLKGLHNLYNSTCVIYLSEVLNINQSILKHTLLNFKGVARRMQIIYNKIINDKKSLYVMNDYAHHPTEIMMTLKTLKDNYDHFLVIWEPHRISRFCYFFNDFYTVFNKHCGWKRLIIMPTFCAGDNLADFPNYKKQLNYMKSKSLNKRNSKIDFKQIYHLLHNEGRSIVAFLGAGRSNHEAYSFVQFYKTLSIP